jgi:uncharacterized protein YegP (UPF0339 family)
MKPLGRSLVLWAAAVAVAGALGTSPAAVAQEKKGRAALTFEIYKDGTGAFRWRLRAPNGQVVATSGQGYKAKADCQRGVELIKKEAGRAKVEDRSTE